jgi:penicillin-binding protein-related factor A (putative recombinase)
MFYLAYYQATAIIYIIHILHILCVVPCLAFVFFFRSTLDDVEKLSSTDVECYWNKNKTEATSVFEPKPVRSCECVKVAKRC